MEADDIETFQPIGNAVEIYMATLMIGWISEDAPIWKSSRGEIMKWINEHPKCFPQSILKELNS